MCVIIEQPQARSHPETVATMATREPAVTLNPHEINVSIPTDGRPVFIANDNQTSSMKDTIDSGHNIPSVPESRHKDKTDTTHGKAIPSGSHKDKTSSHKSKSGKSWFQKGLISRGVYKSNPLGTAAFIGLRALDPLLQFRLLGGSFSSSPLSSSPSPYIHTPRDLGWGESLLSSVGIPSIPLLDHALTTAPDIDISTSILSSTSSHGHGHGLTGLPLPRLILLLMATGSSLKHIYWLLFTSREEFPLSAGLPVSLYNTLFNSLSSLLLLAVPTSASLSTPRVSIPIPILGTLSLPLPMAIGTAMYIAGLAVEISSEIHRKKFKDDPKNKGKICDTGLWAKARHVNYAGYTLWRTGYALAAGGWIVGLGVAGFHLWGFAKQSIVLMDEYMTERYGDKWEGYKRQVRWKMFPGIY